MQRFAMAFVTWLAFAVVLNISTRANTTPAYHENEPSGEPANKTASTAKALEKLVDESQGNPSKITLAISAGGRPVEVFYFPGTCNQNALVLGGVHGSELSGIEVATLLVAHLRDTSRKPYYSTWVVPCLFPDNAFAASRQSRELNSWKNIGRYTSIVQADPNRQMPGAGTAYSPLTPQDVYGRKIEPENRLLLDVIQYLNPERILSIHASHAAANAGIFADPRTDCQGIALGFEQDSALVISMAKQLQRGGVGLPGNELLAVPNARYKSDPPIVPAGQFQKRKKNGSTLPGNRGSGISLGTWASTAVCVGDEAQIRPAAMMITMEVNGCQRSCDYTNTVVARKRLDELQALAEVIAGIFVGNVVAANLDNGFL